MVDNDLKDSILKHADIVKVIESFLPVIKKGKNYFAICPFHNDTNPSLVISPEKQIFKCFVCGATGTAISFVMRYKNLQYFDALKTVAEISGFDDPRLHKNKVVAKVDDKATPLLKCLKDLTNFYQYALNTSEGKEGLDYFESRHIDENLRSKFLLGYANKDGKATCNFLQQKGHSLKTIEDIGIGKLVNGVITDKNQGRVIFPICNSNGDVVGYSARRLKDSDEAKYINSPETYLFHKSNILYNYHLAKDKARIAKHIYLLEGFMDVFALARIGIDNAVALMGTALTNEHISMLRNLNCEIRLCLDGDFAGQLNTMSACKTLSNAGLNVRIVNNQNSKRDPDEILNEDGPDGLRNYLNNLFTYPEFALNYYKNTNPLKTSSEKNNLIKEFVPILLSLKNDLEVDTYIRKLSNITGYEIDSIRQLLARVRKSQSAEQKMVLLNNFHPERKVLNKLILAEREFLFQMMSNKKAIDFYEEKIGGFYDEVYRNVATFIVEYAQTHNNVNISEVISDLEMSDLENKQELIKELTDLLFEKNDHPKKCDDELLNDLMKSMSEEKEKIFERDTLNSSLEGKSELEKARILAEYNKKKAKKGKN